MSQANIIDIQPMFLASQYRSFPISCLIYADLLDF
jgi:hypothetical protein